MRLPHFPQILLLAIAGNRSFALAKRSRSDATSPDKTTPGDAVAIDAVNLEFALASVARDKARGEGGGFEAECEEDKEEESGAAEWYENRRGREEKLKKQD